MFTEKENSRSGLSKRLEYLHSIYGMGVRFSPEGNEGDEGEGNQGEGNQGEGNQGGEGNVFTIPDAFKDKPYLSDVKDYNALFTKLDGAESMLGAKRTMLPTEHSTPDQVASFNRDRGVPDSDTSYTPTNQEEGADNSFFDAMKPAFKKANMTQADVTTLEAELIPVLEQLTGKSLKLNKELDADFDARMDSMFGATKDADMANAKLLMTAHTPQSMAADVEALGNKELAIMASVLKGVRSKYIKEDGSALDGEAGSGASGLDELQAEGRKQIGIAQDPTKSMAERQAAEKKAQEIYAKHDDMSKK